MFPTKKNPWNVDVYMTNVFAIKILNLSFNWSLDVIYDDDTRIFGTNGNSPALQLKSIIGARGFSLKYSCCSFLSLPPMAQKISSVCGN